MLKKTISIMIMLGGTIATATTLEPHNEPIVAITPPKPNIMMVLDTSGSMTYRDMTMPDGYVPLKEGYDYNVSGGKITRLAAMQWVVLGLFQKYRYQANIGFSPLDYGYNAWSVGYGPQVFLARSIEDDRVYKEIKEKLLNLKFSGRTPLNSPTYRVSVILRGKYKEYQSSIQLKSPIEYRCQEQHIILLTDGVQNEHAYSYTLLPEDRKLQGIAENKSLNALGERLSEIDIIKESKNKQPNDKKDRAGADWLSEGYKKMPIYVHAVRFSQSAISEDKNLADFVSHTGGKGVFVKADNTEDLDIGFHRIFQSIIETRSGTGSAEDKVGSGRTVDSIRYTSYYDPFNWTGEIKANAYKTHNDKGTFDQEVWSTNDTIKPNQGLFISYDKGLIALDKLSGLDKKDVSWLQGNHVQDYRSREGRLSDIIDSHLTYSAKDLLNINLNMLSDEIKKEFLDYLVQKNKEKSHYNYLIAGSNDGLLNFIYGDKASKGKGGQRHTTYFPSFFVEDIKEIVNVFYKHSYKVNGTTALFDAKIGRGFKTLGITSMGAGKEGLVGYQLYSSGGETAIKPNFEIYQTAGYESLGYTYSDVEFFNRSNGLGEAEALAVFGNGYTLHRKEGSRPSTVFIIDAEKGNKKVEITLPGGRGGASSPAIIVSQDQHGLQQLERIYVGDQSGKLFRITFNTMDATPLESYSVTTLFDAGEKHPITVKPTLIKDPKSSHIWVYFGTGRAILLADDGKESLVTHNFYGIKDTGTLVTINNLDRQEMTGQHKDDDVLGADSRQEVLEVSKNVNGQSKHGWYLSLKMKGVTEATGERVIFPASVYDGKSIVFSTYGIHQDERLKNDPCLSGGIFGKLIFLDLFSGNGSRYIGGGAGIISNDTSFGVLTGPGITSGNILSGGYSDDNDYKSIVDELKADNNQSSHPNQDDSQTDCSFVVNDMSGGTTTIYHKCESDIKSRRMYLKHIM